MALELTEHERESDLWKRIKAHYEERLASLRRKNDSSHDPIKTADIRGQIKDAKYLLSLDTPQTKYREEEVSY